MPKRLENLYFYTVFKSFVMNRFHLLLLIGVTGLCLNWACKKDLEEKGCVRGKGFGVTGSVFVGCMSREEFYQYLDSPYHYYNGRLIYLDITWKTVSSCNECY